MIQRRSARTGEMGDKENRKGVRKAIKSSCMVKPLAQAQMPLTPNNSSRVRPVPNFNKLHMSFQLQMEKAKKKNQHPTEFKTFDLTPVAKRSVKDSSREVKEKIRKKGERDDGEGDSEEKSADFEPRPDCLQAILHNQPMIEPAAQTPSDPLVRGQPTVVGVALSPRRQIRLSVYTKRDRALHKLLQSKCGVDLVSGSASCPRSSQFHQLLQGMVQSTATTLRTVSCLAREEATRDREEVGLEGVKLRLESQLEEVAAEEYGSQPSVTKPHLQPNAPTHHSSSITHPLEHLSLPPCKPSFYHEEQELKAIVWRTDYKSSSCHFGEEKRPTCPLPKLLEQCYVTSITNMISKDNF